MLILGVETSCDETSAAVLSAESGLRGHAILSQDVHAIYGGVVPELAARAHIRVLDDVVQRALTEAGVELRDIDVYGVTAGPGLIGALLVGVTYTKSVAYALGKPLIGVHHMEAHLFSASVENAQSEPPFVALLVSGGHTMLLWVPEWGAYELLGETRDDAAGEAFDKVAKILELGYPGGPVIERAARAGDAKKQRFTRPMLTANQTPEDRDYYDFSFSGLKTAVLTRARQLQRDDVLGAEIPNLAAGFQASVINVLVAKTMRAVEAKDCPRVLIGGGVAANRPLRDALTQKLGARGHLFYPSPRLATDNAAMIARAALFRHGAGELAGLDLAARADMPFPGLTRPA